MSAAASIPGVKRVETIRRSHILPIPVARAHATRIAETLDREFHPQSAWYGDRLVFHVPSGMAAGVGGFIDVGPTEIHVLVDLPGMLGLLNGQVEKQIVEELDKVLK